eukprot:TRINITY_DN6380_c0_g1_i1.p1 TRINITY_DN6380_c0_g1~~TRINITY_DN6380_c0_g1_i1.p1  ORF type:complete len:2666 (+),score=1035.88 TRINITY_DN6380_c0_g1_i1:190-8187(+)
MDIIFAEKELVLDSALILGLDVDNITQVTPELLEDNEAALDDLEDVCVHLIDAEIPNDTPDAVELLRVAQLALEYRSYLWDVERREREEDNLDATDKIRALEKKLSSQGGEETPRDAVTPRSTPRHQLQKYVDMVEKLEGELDDVRYGSETLASDLDAKRAEYEALEDDHAALEKEFSALKLKLEKMDLDFEASNSEMIELRDELTREKKQNHYLQAELEKTKKGATRNRGRASVAQDEIGSLKHQIDQLETERKALQGEVVQQANEVLSINVLLQATEEVVDTKNRELGQFEKERDAARGQVAALQMEIEEKDDSIQQVIEHQKRQVQQWAEECAGLKADMEEKDRTILDLHSDLKKLRDNARERTLQSEIEKRDTVVNGKQKSIELLEDQIEIKELELLQWAKNYKAFEEESARGMAKALEEQYEHYKDMEMDAERKVRANDKLQEMADEAVQQNIEIETELLEVKSRMDQYERGTWGLFEAINEIKKLKEQGRKHDYVEQEARKKIINEKEKVAKMYHENQFLRQKAGIPDEHLIDHSQLNVEVHRKQQRLMAKNEQLLREIERLEDERLELKDQLLHEADVRADLGVNKLGLNVHCQRILQDFAVKLRDEGEEAVPLNDKSLDLKQRVRELENENDRLVLQLHDVKLNNTDNPRPLPLEAPSETPGGDKTEAYFQELVSLLKNAGTPGGGGPGSGVPSTELQQQLERREEQVRQLEKQLDSLRPDSLQAVLVVDTQIGADDEEYARQVEGSLCSALDAAEDQVKVGFAEKLPLGQGTGVVLHLLLKGALSEDQKPAEELLVRLKGFVGSVESTRVIPGLNRTASMERLEHKCTSAPGVPSTLFGVPSAQAMPKVHAHLMEVLQQLEQRETELSTLQVEMEVYHDKFLMINDEHVQLVRQHLATKTKWQRDLQLNKESEQRAQTELGKAKIELQEMEQLRKVITTEGEDGLKSIASDALRKSSLAQISELELYRRHNTLKAQHKIVDSELQTVRTELRRMEESLGHKLARLTHQFEVSEQRVSLCMGELQGSVTQSEFDRLSELCVAINAKYCSQLDRERALTVQVRDSNQLCREVEHLKTKLNKVETELSIAAAEKTNYKEALDKLGEDDGVVPEVTKLRTEVMQLRASENSATTRCEINEANHKSILEANESLRVKLESRLADVEGEVIQLTDRIRHEQELAEQLTTKFSGGLSREQAKKLTEQLRAQEKHNGTLTVDLSTYKSVAELGTNQLKELQSYYLSQVEQVRSLNASLEEFSAGGDVEAQLAKALLEATTMRVKKTQLERRVQKVESEAEFKEERESQLNLVLDAKRVVVFKLQTLLRGIKVKYEHELQNARMQVVSRPSEDKVEAWNEAIHKARTERDTYEVEAFNARVREEELVAELQELKGRSDSFSVLIASLNNASTPLDAKISELSQQVQDLAVSESALKRLQVRQSKQLVFQQEMQKENEETTLKLEGEVAEKNTTMQGLRDEAKALRFDNMQLQNMATLLEQLKQDKISEAEFKASLAQTRKAQAAARATPGGAGAQEETAGGVLLEEELMARRARRGARRHRKAAAVAALAERPVKSCCLTIDHEFSDIPEGSKERKQFCASFVKDLCNSLGVTEECITLGMLTEGSVIVPFALRVPEGQDLDATYDDLNQQTQDPGSKLRAGVVTGKINPAKTKQSMGEAAGQSAPAPKQQQEEEDEEDYDDEDDFPVIATQSDSGALGSAAPTPPVHAAAAGIDNTKVAALQQKVVMYEDKVDALDSENAKFRRQCAAEQKKVARLQDVITAQEIDMRNIASGKGGGLNMHTEMAAGTIDGLQARLTKKDTAMRAMRDRLETTEADMLTQKNIYEQQLSDMTERLNDIDTARLRKLTDKLHRLDRTEEVGDEMVEMTELGKQEIAARDKMISRLQNDVERIEDENRQFEHLIADKNKEIDELEWQVQTLKDRPASSAPVVIEKPKARRAPKEAAELADVKKENKTLRDANKQLQIKMLEAAEAASRRPAEPQNELQRRMVDEATSQMAQRLQSLHERSQRMKAELERMKESNGELMGQAEDSSKRLAEARKEKEALVSEKAEMQSEMSKLRQHSSNKGEAQEDMSSKHRSLMQAYKTLKAKHQELSAKLEEAEERSSRTTGPAQNNTKSDVAVERWEKEKKLQRMIDTLKQKLAAKQSEIEDAGKTTERLKTELAATSRAVDRPTRSAAGRNTQASNMGQTLEELGSVLELKQQLLRVEEAKEEAEKKELMATAKNESLARDKVRAEEKLEMATRLQSVMGGSSGGRTDGVTLNDTQKRLTQAQEQVTELQFDLEASKHTAERQAQHIATLETAIAAMQSMGLSQQQSRNTLEANGKGSTRDRDLQKVVEGLNEVVANLQAENDTLKRKADNFSDALASAKALRGKCAKLEAENKKIAEKDDKVAELESRVTKLNEIGLRTAKQLKKQTESTEKLRALVKELNTSKETLARDLEHAEQQLNAGVQDRSEQHSMQSSHEREKRVLEDSLIALQDKNRRLESQLERWRKELKDARNEASGLRETVEDLRSGEIAVASELAAAQAGQQSMSQLMSEVSKLKQLAKQLQDENARLARHQMPEGSAGDEGVKLKIRKLEEENKDLRSELSSFDPAFWEEIEDLKYREHESKQLNKRYESMLSQLSQQYGFPFKPRASGR